MLAKTYGAALQGIDATIVTIEANTTNFAGEMCIVGLPDNAVKESSKRIQSAININAYNFPRKSVVVNMSPADIKKEGASWDLPIAIAVLATTGQVRQEMLSRYMLMGELSLDGTLQPIRGALSIAIEAQKAGFKAIILPYDNTQEAAVVKDIAVYGADNLRDVVRILNQEAEPIPTIVDIDELFAAKQDDYMFDFADVRGQDNVKKAMEVAAAGGHNMLMVGPPGSGKSMMAKRMPSILPPLTMQEALQTTKIHSVAGIIGRQTALLTQRPFRSPHHTVTDVALVGGGQTPMPGEISLAHNGVLFLDELPEYKRSALEVMRQPLEDRKICIARAKQTVEYPASFMLVAAMNPCPCGHYNDPTHACTCTPAMVHKYLGRISGPLLDRIDIQIEITPVPFERINSEQQGEPSASIRQRVIKARRLQAERFKGIDGIFCNAQMTPQLMRRYCQIDQDSQNMLRIAMERFGLSARAYDRILKVARTIADLQGADNIQMQHTAEAISYRNLDRSDWGG